MSKISDRELEVPEAWSLAQIRATTQAVHDAQDVAKAIGVSARQAGYHLQAGRILGWLRRNASGHILTSSGRRLLRLAVGSPEEHGHIRRSIETAPLVLEVLPKLFEQATHASVKADLMAHSRTKLVELEKPGCLSCPFAVCWADSESAASTSQK